MGIYKNHKFFGKISLVDMFVLIILIALGVATYNRFFSYKNANNPLLKSSVNFVYTIKFEFISKSSEDMLKIGDKVYDKLSGSNIGEIIDLKIEASKDEFVTQQGNILLKEVPNKITIIMQIKTNGTYNNGEYLANDLIRILIGGKKNIATKYVEMTGNIIDIKMEE